MIMSQTVAGVMAHCKMHCFPLHAKLTSDVDMCIFIDALDEHGGEHRDLLLTLDQLGRLIDNHYFRPWLDARKISSKVRFKNFLVS